MGRRKVATTVYLTAEQDMRLKELNQRTKIPVAELVRQGVDLVLERYEQGLVDLQRRDSMTQASVRNK